MFRKSQRHIQPLLISNVSQLPARHRQRLEQSWAGEFYRECFCRLQEEPFAVLYSDVPSRPNVPVNVLVGLEILKAGFGWSDDELYDHYTYDVQVRYALGLHELGEGDFDLRSLYNFRQRLSHYNQVHGTNLLAAAFVGITDQQLTRLQVRTQQQRMDSTQIASNILDASRLHLLVEAVQRLWRGLSAADQARYQADFAPYVAHSSGQYVYRVKGRPATLEHLQRIGGLLHRLLSELAADYGQEPVFQVAQRLLRDNFDLHATEVEPKANAQISAGCLQSLDDQEATYREKAGREYKGYVANVSETCDPANPLQLITHIQVASNSTEDSALMAQAVPALKARMALDTLHTDGGYASPAADAVLDAQQVELVPTAIRGRAPTPGRIGLTECELQLDAQGQTVPVRPGRAGGAFVADLDPQVCAACPFYQDQRCRPWRGKRDGRFRLDFNQREVLVAVRRRARQAQRQTGQNLRVAIEATMRVLKHPFSAGKLSVRGLFRVTCLLIGSALMANVRSIHRYRQTLRATAVPQAEAQGDPGTLPNPASPFWLAALRRCLGQLASRRAAAVALSC